MLKLFGKYWPLLALTVVVFAFFAKLFFPPSIFVTPDYGRSDLLHFNIPVRTFSQDALKNLQLPLWEPSLGQGFPLFEEGQIGFFYLPNIILFGIFPFWLAFNLSFVATFIIAAFGTYFLARSFEINKKGSYLAAVTFAFSPIFILQISHLNLIQTASLTPWLFWLTNSYFEKKKNIFLLLLPLFVSQQIFAGFTQLFVYSLTGLTIFVAFKIKLAKNSKMGKVKITAAFLSVLIFAVILASVQILSSAILAKQSGRIDGTDPKKILLDFPYKPKNLSTVLDPYILGNVGNGTYPHYKAGVWGVFWESNSYFGIVQLIIILGLIISLFGKSAKTRNKNIIFLVALGILALSLSLGPYAPLHPVFSFPPYSYFRVPARFLLLFFLSAAAVAGFALDKITAKNHLFPKIIALAIILLASLDIFRVWSNYNLVGPAAAWLSPPPITKAISGNSRVFNFGQNEYWNSVFATRGWQKPEDGDYYFFYRNFLGQNQNADFNVSNLLVYGGISPNRNKIMENLANFDIKNENGVLEIGPVSQKTLDSANTGFITTSYPTESASWQKISQVQKGDQIIYLYQNRQNLPHAFIVTRYHVSRTIQDVVKTLNSPDFDPRQTVILEKNVGLPETVNSLENRVEIKKYEKTKVEIETSLKSAALTVLSDSFYPGWEAEIDGIRTEILAANINSRAILTPAGNHLITFSYKPKLIFWGLVITFVAHLVYIAFLAKKLLNRHAKLPLA
ncbi:MAG: hypothetical protein Q7S45_02385 [Candidatus Curtissbacteria bacterium]|nr:hypothetical protein [Candidatus Curtissbacteria bacterium]